MAYTPEQRRDIAIAKQMSRGDAPRVRQALLEAMAVESNFRNLHYGDRDSLGVLQQRPSAGWKNPTNVRTAINSFLTRAVRNNQGFRGSAGQLAQSVQQSAFPDRYDQRAKEASALLGSNMGGAGYSPGYGLASRLRGDGGSTAPSQGYRQQVAAFLLQSSAAAAAGQPQDPNGLLNLAMLRSQQDSSAPAGPSAPGGAAPTASFTGGGNVQFVGKPLSGEKPDFIRKIKAAVASIGGTHVRVISGYRSPSYNRAVGGASNSNHIYGRAMDAQVLIPKRGWVDLGTALQHVAPKFGLRSGASFNYGGRPDTPHVDDAYNQHH